MCLLAVGQFCLDRLKDPLLIGRPEVARAAEAVVGAVALPVLCYVWLPAYRAFGNRPDRQDLNVVLKEESKVSRDIHSLAL